MNKPTRILRIDVLATTGGIPPGSDLDFVSDYPKRVFDLVEIGDLNFVAADRMNLDAKRRIASALYQIDRHHAAAAGRELT